MIMLSPWGLPLTSRGRHGGAKAFASQVIAVQHNEESRKQSSNTSVMLVVSTLIWDAQECKLTRQ